MTRKDYILIASAFADAHSNAPEDFEALCHAAYRVALKLEEDNPRFDRIRFLNACKEIS